MRHLFPIFMSTILFIACFAPVTPSYATNTSQVDVVILFNDKIDDQLINHVNGTITSRYESIQAISVTVAENQIPYLKSVSSVKFVQYDQEVRADAQYVDYGIESTKANVAHQAGVTGTGVKVAVLDTGIDTTHPDLKVTGGICVLPVCSNSYNDDHGHGTHVAGIISALNNDVGTLGAAPDVSLYAVKVLDHEGNGSTSTIIAGIDWAIQNEMDIINLSLSTPEASSAMEMVVDKAYESGILVVAAAGNQGTTSGIEDTVEYPARYPSVIAVGNINSSLKRVASSATGDTLEFVAPGDKIFSTVPLALDPDSFKDGYTWMAGTSMSGPFVSGILAIYIQKYPNKTNVELRQMLVENSIDIGNPGRDTLYGYGLVQANEPTLDIPQVEVSLVSTTNGVVKIDVSMLSNEVSSYNVYRNGKQIKTKQTNISVTDYVVKGDYNYQFSSNALDGTESGLSKSLNVQVTAPNFSDLTSMNWYTAPLVYLISESIVTGVGDGTVRPGQLVTRGEAVTMIGRAIELNGTLRNTVFPDIDPENYASGFVQSSFEEEIITGYPDGTLRPNQPVTRAEMAILIARAYKMTQIAPNSFIDVKEGLSGYDEISKILYLNITTGFPDGTFRPHSYMTRAEFSAFLARAENEEFR